MVNLSNYASSMCSVCLTGDGGDEIFSGYNRHKFINDYWSLTRRTPKPVLKVIEKACAQLSTSFLPILYDSSYKVLPQSFRIRLVEQKLEKLGRHSHPRA